MRHVCSCWFTCRVERRCRPPPHPHPSGSVISHEGGCLKAPAGRWGSRGCSVERSLSYTLCSEECFLLRLYLSHVPLSQESEVCSSSGGGGGADCFSPCWKWSADFCDDVQCRAPSEQNPDGGGVMIVWFSGGGENGADGEPGIAMELPICQGVPPPPTTRQPHHSD